MKYGKEKYVRIGIIELIGYAKCVCVCVCLRVKERKKKLKQKYFDRRIMKRRMNVHKYT